MGVAVLLTGFALNHELLCGLQRKYDNAKPPAFEYCLLEFEQ
jgi:hypothetical protein